MPGEILVSLLLLVGGGFTLLGSVGLARLPDFFTRMHGPTKATTLGVGAIVLASLAHVGAREDGAGLRELAITLFLFITAPVTAHLLSKAALAEARRRDAAQGAGAGAPPPGE
ncbi:Na+/H+ antiporter subunit G [Caldovatus aquaticus]|uniref:Na+/H+ antiporter subunit G n=1 Tax=Caldovatus aquaticus TaxID=2865671 RepID=A0ABS7F6Q3_9PROT|nr:Na+/H+ antiporter subunit G [Caldovatus aquaticus]MBW8271159.1 Na+/H+ antiporter subunit G [Caldovatus aquaticus]